MRHATHANKKIVRYALLFILLCTVNLPGHAQEADPDKIINEVFWGQMYKEGGKTFYCKKSFDRKGPLLSESYIYSTSWIRDHLRCGTNRQCKKESAEYRQIISDLHNIVPADSYFEFKRKNSIFGGLDKSVPIKKCGSRKKLHVIEPPDDIKGDIARVILYMHNRYDLPLVSSFPYLSSWNKHDPPSEAEIQRNTLIKKIQGNGNPFVESPSLINDIQK